MRTITPRQLRRIIREELVKRTVGEEDRFIDALRRAENLLAYGVSKEEAIETLMGDGIARDIAYFAVVAASTEENV